MEMKIVNKMVTIVMFLVQSPFMHSPLLYLYIVADLEYVR